jgi:hypothetical protein
MRYALTVLVLLTVMLTQTASAQVGLAAISLEPDTAYEADLTEADNRNNWLVYAKHEEKAFTDYWWRMSGPDVIDNGRQLRDLSRSAVFGQGFPTCGGAALTLSHMITGQYFSSRRLAVSADWHALTESFIEQRRACIAALKIDIREFPLPGWLGR